MQSRQEKPEQYDPNNLLSAIIEHLNLKNDAALSRALDVSPPVISKIRHKRLPVGASMLIRMHEISDLSIRELRELMGDQRHQYRIGHAQKNRGETHPDQSAAY
ncbi:hypothetical protein NB640_03280 [Oxalobacter vibrioformis]|uniref:Uncharacterized protein n=1 Tax=Oxalobacter vibrioformis TaxID=933080 RepID=A0A9E9P4N3_9BURK|nr:hypothetical protein [Oxalobacter vibrioformis]NLC23316.1 hypothetical protein [Oxalobacter sp.]WAW11278.1 hypothetical protein NB640_03280 [Oxalobacter vibrioformis]